MVGNALKTRPSLKWEIRFGHPSSLVAGIDEVGRGCLAGPVVAAALALPARVDYSLHPWLGEISDSKRVRPALREQLVPKIEGWATAWSLGVASVEEIDRVNIYYATHLAMCRAAEALDERLRIGNRGLISHILIDGDRVPRELGRPATAVVKGDLQCLSIAAASILAKVWRDRLMVELDRAYPGYGFAAHKGYFTPSHASALRKLGPCAIHRRSFAPVVGALGPEAASRPLS